MTTAELFIPAGGEPGDCLPPFGSLPQGSNTPLFAEGPLIFDWLFICYRRNNRWKESFSL